MTVPESNPDLSCPMCGDTFIVTGDTEIARNRALRDWRGCCVPNRSLATTRDHAVDAGAPTSTVARSSAVEAREGATRSPRLLAPSRLLQRIPTSIRRRVDAESSTA